MNLLEPFRSRVKESRCWDTQKESVTSTLTRIAIQKWPSELVSVTWFSHCTDELSPGYSSAGNNICRFFFLSVKIDKWPICYLWSLFWGLWHQLASSSSSSSSRQSALADLGKLFKKWKGFGGSVKFIWYSFGLRFIFIKDLNQFMSIYAHIILWWQIGLWRLLKYNLSSQYCGDSRNIKPFDIQVGWHWWNGRMKLVQILDEYES